MEQTAVIDQSKAYGDEVNQMIDESAGDHNAIRLNTFHGYWQNEYGESSIPASIQYNRNHAN
jgi:hypothetical protein